MSGCRAARCLAGEISLSFCQLRGKRARRRSVRGQAFSLNLAGTAASRKLLSLFVMPPSPTKTLDKAAYPFYAALIV